MGDSIIPMSYSQLDKLYDKATLIVDGDYSTKIGGVYRPWDVFNHNELVIQDSVTFANVSSKYGASSQFIESPWKIHLSIQPEDLGKAWDIIYPILKAHQIPLFKTSRLSVSRILYIQMQKAAPGFLEQHNINSEEKKQSIQDIVRVFNGMQITIYIENGKEHEYNNILSEIEPLLYAAGINPGIIDKSDRAIGFYSSIRHVGKGYTSHDKVSGYKQVTERDPFYVIHPKFKDVRINWSTFDYSNHIIKAKITLEQLVDAKRKYDLALITKREYHQSCDVASEYFKRWYELIKRTLVPSQLSTYNNLSLVKFKKWINDGHRLIPALRKERLQNFKEAEDILHASDQYRAWDLSRPRIKRNQGQRNLLNLLSPRQTLVKAPSKSEQVENKSDTAIILKKLSEHRKTTFTHTKSCSLPLKASGEMTKENEGRIATDNFLPIPQSSIEQELLQEPKSDESILATQGDLSQAEPGFFWRGSLGVCSAVIGLLGSCLVLGPITLVSWGALAITFCCGLMGAGVGYLSGSFMDTSYPDEVTFHAGKVNSPLSNNQENILCTQTEKNLTSSKSFSNLLVAGSSLKWDAKMFPIVEKQNDFSDDGEETRHLLR